MLKCGPRVRISGAGPALWMEERGEGCHIYLAARRRAALHAQSERGVSIAVIAGARDSTCVGRAGREGLQKATQEQEPCGVRRKC